MPLWGPGKGLVPCAEQMALCQLHSHLGGRGAGPLHPWRKVDIWEELRMGPRVTCRTSTPQNKQRLTPGLPRPCQADAALCPFASMLDQGMQISQAAVTPTVAAETSGGKDHIRSHAHRAVAISSQAGDCCIHSAD